VNLDLTLVLFQIVVLLFSFSVHEAVHAYAAMRFGDPTAYMLGRVTLNPARHIDPWGSILMPAVSFLFGGTLVGWGKPVPVTLRNFKKIKRDDSLSTLAGLLSHLALATIAVVLLIVLKHTTVVGGDAVVSAMRMVNHDPSVDMTALPRLFPLALLLYYCVVMNILLFVFNLIPVPPLDGSRFIRYVLPYNVERMYDRIGMLGSFVMFFLAARIIFPIFYPPLIGTFDGLLLSL
jgi:Zn-dependent protease